MHRTSAPSRQIRLAAVSVATLAATALAAGPVWAAGVEYPDNGTIAIGRGGAWAANPSDGLAFQYNPAGLAQQRGLRLMLDGRMAFQSVGFESTSGISTRPGQAGAIENSASGFFGPSAALSYGFGPKGPFSELTVALGATGPSSIGKVKYPDEGAQRYALHSTDYFIGYYSAALAAGIGKYVRVGLTGQLAHGNAQFKQAVYSGVTEGSDPDYDTIATFSGKSGWIPTGILGLTVLPFPGLAVGISYRPKVEFVAPGTLETVAPEKLRKDSKQVGNGAELHLNFADMLRAGVAWDVTPRLQLELDGVWERWSVLQEIRIRTIDITVKPTDYEPEHPIKVSDIVFPHEFKDTYSARLGGEYAWFPERLSVRAGYLFETSAAPSKYVSVDFANWGRHVASLGGSLGLYGMWLDVAYAHHFVDTQTVTDSEVKQQLTPSIIAGFDSPKPKVVGNGIYSAGMNIVSVSLRVPWEKLNGKF